MNNKGFSLVELIVVVLIMAIIGVALAPQVMKWVGNARESADVNNYNSLYANVQLALADKAAYEEVKDQDGKTIILTMSSSGVAVTGTATSTDFQKALTALDSGWTKLGSKVSGESYQITVTCGNPPQIAKNDYPGIISEDLK